MPKASKEQVKRETDIIRHLSQVEGLKDYQIRKQLGIDRSTLWRYFQRINKQDAKEWQKSFLDPNLVNARAKQMERILEDGLSVCIKQMNDGSLEPREQREAVMLADTISAHLLKLAMKGPTFTMLPEVKYRFVEDKKPLENKQS